MYYEVYLDAVFITNFIMDFILLRLLSRIFRYESSWLRLILGAAIGAVGSCLILLIPTDDFLPAAILLHGVSAFFMVRTGFRVRTKSMLAQAVTALYFTAFLCGGFWEVLSAGSRVTPKTFLLFSAVTYEVLNCAALVRDYWKMRTGNLYKVHISYQGKVLFVKGFYDTGNQLVDLGSKKPVSVASWKMLEQLLPETAYGSLRAYQKDLEEQDKGEWRNLKPHFLTFQSVGNPSGLAVAVTLDEMCIHGEHRMVWIHRPVIAIPQEEFLEKKDYQIILNANLLDD